jgi:uncharacterized protein YqjF (DUF2071 family)
MFQSWQSLTFLHWRYDEAQVRPLVPAGLQLDTWDGSAWVSLAPFMLRDLHAPGLPPVPVLSHFPETNLRTYVRGPDGYRGIWFFSLDAARLTAVLGARTSFGLPYMWARMKVIREGGRVHYRSARLWPFGGAINDMIVEPGELYEARELGELDHFLTARFRLYALRRGRLSFAQVEHPRWPLARARLISLNTGLPAAGGLPAAREDPLVHYAQRVDVWVAAPKPA